MDNQVGRSRPAGWDKQDDSLDYGLKHLNLDQRKHAYMVARATLERVMMDPASPGFLKDLIRSQNAIGMIGLQQLLAIHADSEVAAHADDL